MTMTSQERAEQNRRNAQKSTGPRTQEGKDRSRFNALKHGIRARLPMLPGEDPAVYQARLDGWVCGLQPMNAVELFLVQRAVHVSWQLDRADRVEALRLVDRQAAEAEKLAQAVAAKGAQLFRAPGGSIDAFPFAEENGTHGPISWPSSRSHPEHPERLIVSLESSAAGCSWLLERWRALGRILDGGCWQAPDRLRAVRLLGCQPCDLVTEPKVWAIYVACEWMAPGGIDLDREILDDFNTPALASLRDRMLQKFKKATSTRNHCGDQDGRAELRALVNSAIERLENLLADRTAREQDGLSPTMATVGFDESGSGESLRRHQVACDRSLFRTLESLRRVRKYRMRVDAADDGPVDPRESPGPGESGYETGAGELTFEPISAQGIALRQAALAELMESPSDLAACDMTGDPLDAAPVPGLADASVSYVVVPPDETNFQVERISPEGCGFLHPDPASLQEAESPMFTISVATDAGEESGVLVTPA